MRLQAIYKTISHSLIDISITGNEDLIVADISADTIGMPEIFMCVPWNNNEFGIEGVFNLIR